MKSKVLSDVTELPRTCKSVADHMARALEEEDQEYAAIEAEEIKEEMHSQDDN